MVRSLSQKTSDALPTEFHHLIARLAHEGRLLRLYTQNVDGIDTSMPPLKTTVPLNEKGPWCKTIQLHGGLDKMVCSKCRNIFDFKPELFEGPEPPSCTSCEDLDSVRTLHAGKRSHGIGKLRPRMVLYNEHNPDGEAIGAVTTADLRSRPDAVIVVGTSLKVPGVKRIVKEMCGVTRGRKSGVTIWINHGPEPTGIQFDDCWDLVVRGDCEEVAKNAMLPHWDEPDPIYEEVDTDKVDKIRREMSVVVERHPETPSKKSKQITMVKGMLTPAGSPKPAKSKVTFKAKDEASPTKSLSGTFKLVSQKMSLSEKSTKTAKIKPAADPSKPKRKYVRKTPSAPRAPKDHKINSAFKLQKTIKTTTEKKGLHSSEQLSVVIDVKANAEFATSQENIPQTPTAPQRNDSWKSETVSPKGQLPADLARMMN
jgi:NAD+-dependent protein deacetylase SIR2